MIFNHTLSPRITCVSDAGLHQHTRALVASKYGESMKKAIITISLLLIASWAFAQTPEWQWASHAGGSDYESSSSIAIDSDGNSYVTGYFENNAIFGSYTLTSLYDTNIFVAKLDTDGNWLWATQAGGNGSDYGSSIATDCSGNSYVIGSFENTATFGLFSLTSYGDRDIFVAKLDTDGNWLWVKQAGGTINDTGRSISLDNNGNCYVTGYFTNSAFFGSTSLISDGGHDIFVAKLDTNGNWLWATQAGGNGSDYGNSIATDNNGSSYVTGKFEGAASFGSFLLSNYSIYFDDIFVAKLDTEGNWIWATQAGGINFYFSSSIAIDSNGNSYIASCLQHAAAFGSHPLIQNGVYNIFVAKLDADGNWVWASQADGIMCNNSKLIATDNSGTSYITGSLGSELSTFGSISLTAIGSYDIFVAAIDPNGYWLSATNAGGTNSDNGRTITIDNNGSSYVSGVFKGTATFGSNSLTSYGNADIFVAKYNSMITNFNTDNTYGYFPLTVNFIDLSLNDPIEWEWDFNNDGTIDSYEQNPTYVYSQPGVYSVSLIVSDGINNNTLIKNEYIEVLESFTADFVAYPVSGPNPHHVYFFDLSLINPVSWEWDFDNDGTIDSYEQNPTHIYNEPGSYAVSLTTGDETNTDTTVKEAYISVLVVSADDNLISSEIHTLSNHPNPFNPSTTIDFSIQNDSNIDLSIFNIKGQLIKNLIQNDFSKGSHLIIWYGDDDNNKPVGSGIYYYQLKVNGETKAVNKCLLLK